MRRPTAPNGQAQRVVMIGFRGRARSARLVSWCGMAGKTLDVHGARRPRPQRVSAASVGGDRVRMIPWWPLDNPYGASARRLGFYLFVSFREQKTARRRPDAVADRPVAATRRRVRTRVPRANASFSKVPPPNAALPFAAHPPL